MVSKRSVPLYLVLGIFVPFFAFYWFYKIANDIKNLKEADDPNSILHLVLGLLTCGIFFWYCYYKYPKHIVDIQEKRQQTVNDISVISLIVGIFVGVVSMALIQDELNKLAEA